MAKEIIHQDDKRTVSVESGTLHIEAMRGSTNMGMNTLRTGGLPADIKQQIKALGQDPEEWYGLYLGGASNPQVAMPPDTRQAVEGAIKRHQTERTAPRMATPADERRKLTSAVYEAREGIQQAMDRGDDAGAAYRAKSAAEANVKAWDEAHPIEAAEINREAKAAALEREAKVALSASADGWIGPEERRKRHDELMAKAADVRAGKSEAAVASPSQPSRGVAEVVVRSYTRSFPSS